LRGVLFRARGLAGAATILDVERKQLGQEGGTVVSVNVLQAVLQPRTLTSAPGSLEGVTGLVCHYNPATIRQSVDARP
jgi:hypothetical protein